MNFLKLPLGCALPLGFALLTSGCGSPEQSIQIRGIPAPDDMCLFASGGDIFIGKLVLDTANSFALRAPIEYRNNMVQMPINGGRSQINGVVNPQWGPRRFVSQWQCDANNNNLSVGALILPSFSTTTPFCLDRRSDFRDIVGQDFVGASGIVAGPAENALAFTDVVTTELGTAVDQLFILGEEADKCADCIRAGQCVNASGAACMRLVSLFGTLGLSTATTGNTPSPDILRFQPFALFNGDYITGKAASPYANVVNNSPFYTMRLAGVLQGATNFGDDVDSDDFSVDVDFCQNCGPLVPGTPRQPRVGQLTRCFTP